MNSRIDVLVSELCYEIDELKMALKESLQREDELRKKYNQLLDDDIQHAQDMSSNMLKVLLVPGVTKAFADNAHADDFAVGG